MQSLSMPRLAGIATQLGSIEIPVQEIGDHFGVAGEYINDKIGVNRLWKFSPDQHLIEDSVRVCQRLLRVKNVRIDQVSGIFGSNNFTAEFLMPSYTAIVGHHLGLRNVICDHIGLGCGGGMQALRNAWNQLRSDSLDGVIASYLVILGDQISNIINPMNMATSIFFSDGVCAVLVTNDPLIESGYEIENVRTTSLLNENIGVLCLRNPFARRYDPPGFLEMHGPGVYEFGKNIFPHILKHAGHERVPSNVYLVPHQANQKILEELRQSFGLNPEQIYMTGISSIGNLLNGSTFFGLTDAVTQNNFPCATSPVWLASFGAELQIGLCVLKPLSRPECILA